MKIDKVQKQLRQFAEDRDWEQFHSPKNLSMALSAETATDSSGNRLRINTPAQVGALPAVVPIPRGQQAIGNQVSVYVVNNTDWHHVVPAHSIVGRGSLTQELENLADSLSQVGADLHIQRVHGIRPGGDGDLMDKPPTTETDQDFLDSMEVSSLYIMLICSWA